MLLGHQIDSRIREISQDDMEFIYSAVEAGWTTPRISREMPYLLCAAVYMVSRSARQEMAQRYGVCEHCRRDIATGKISPTPAPKP